MTIFKLRTRHPVLHPHITDLVVREEGVVEIEARRFGALISRPGRMQVIIPWQNVAEVEVDGMEAFLDMTGEPTDDPLPRTSRWAQAKANPPRLVSPAGVMSSGFTPCVGIRHGKLAHVEKALSFEIIENPHLPEGAAMLVGANGTAAILGEGPAKPAKKRK